MNSEKAKFIFAHPGWVMGADALHTFSLDSQCFQLSIRNLKETPKWWISILALFVVLQSCFFKRAKHMFGSLNG